MGGTNSKEKENRKGNKNKDRARKKKQKHSRKKNRNRSKHVDQETKLNKIKKHRKSANQIDMNNGDDHNMIKLDVEWSESINDRNDDNGDFIDLDGISNRPSSSAYSTDHSIVRQNGQRNSDYHESERTSRATKRRKTSSARGSNGSKITGIDYIDDYDSYYDGNRKRRRSSRLSQKTRINYKL